MTYSLVPHTVHVAELSVTHDCHIIFSSIFSVMFKKIFTYIVN